jgi:hypothetical protein
MTELERAEAGLPKSEAEYSRRYKIPERTLRSWKSSDDGKAILAEIQTERAALRSALAARELGEDSPLLSMPAPDGSGPDVPPVAPVGDSGAAALMNLAFSQLATLIAAGDVRSITTLLSTPVAKQYMESLTAEFTRTFDDVSDEQLVAEILAFVPTDALLHEIATRDVP